MAPAQKMQRTGACDLMYVVGESLEIEQQTYQNDLHHHSASLQHIVTLAMHPKYPSSQRQPS